MVDFEQKKNYQIDDLLKIMELLRMHCPWDRVQTHESIRTNFIEEVYEVAEAIDVNDAGLMKEELGDVLLQILFHTEIEREQGHFTFDDVCDGIAKKLIERHPHIFSDVQAATADKVLDNWNRIKMRQKGQNTYTENLKSVSKSLPSLMRSEKVLGRAKKAGLSFDDISEVIQDILQVQRRLEQLVALHQLDQIQEHLGDLLFQIVNMSRILKLDPEYCLEKSTDRFIDRFSALEDICRANEIDMRQTSPDQLRTIWEKPDKR